MSGHHFLLSESHVLSPLLVNRDAEVLLILGHLRCLCNTAIMLLLGELLVESLVHKLLLELIISVHFCHNVLSLLGAKVRFVVLAVNIALACPLSASLIHLHSNERLVRTHILLVVLHSFVHNALLISDIIVEVVLFRFTLVFQGLQFCFMSL